MHDVQIEIIIDTPGGVEARKLVKPRAVTVVKVETRTLGDTLGQLESKTLINTLRDMLA